MSPSRRPRPSAARSAAPVLLAGLLTATLSACGASMDAQTYQERTQAGATNSAIGTLAVRNVYVLPPEGDRVHEPGDDAVVVLTVTNSDDEDDTLVEASTPAADSVEILADGRPGELDVPALGTTLDRGRLRLIGLQDELREGEYITLTLRFAENGTLEIPVPVATSGETDRPIFTGDGEHEPALQAPAGGHGHGEEGEDPPGGAGVVEGVVEGEQPTDSEAVPGEVPGAEGSVEDDEVDEEGVLDELGNDPTDPTEETADETEGEAGAGG